MLPMIYGCIIQSKDFYSKDKSMLKIILATKRGQKLSLLAVPFLQQGRCKSLQRRYLAFITRYGHKSIIMQVSITDPETNDVYTRKYMYMYGGINHDGSGGKTQFLNDLWFYDIP